MNTLEKLNQMLSDEQLSDYYKDIVREVIGKLKIKDLITEEKEYKQTMLLAEIISCLCYLNDLPSQYKKDLIESFNDYKNINISGGNQK